MIKTNDNFIYLETKNTLLVLEIMPINLKDQTFFNKYSYIIQNYYGPKIVLCNIKPSNSLLNPFGSNDEYNLNKLISSSYGNGNNSEVSILLKNYDHSFINRFYYKEFNIIEGGVYIDGPHARNVSQTLEIVEVDDVVNLELHTYYSLFSNSDIIAVKRKLINRADEVVEIKRLFSLECPIDTRELIVNTFDGKWLYERTRHQTKLTNGTYFIDSKVGSSSHKHNPFIQIEDTTNHLYYGFNIVYSGNHKEVIDVNPLFHSSVFIGLNDFAFNYPLYKDEYFITPEAIMCIATSLDDITSNMHQFILNHIVDPAFKDKERPIIFNNWEGTGMNINEKSLIEMAEIAKRVGVEQFVMDDGWFYNRNNDYAGLGDWFIDKAKFPNGLAPFSQYIHDLGLKFGIWVEPEMINRNTNLFKEHPEFACIIPAREPIEKRHQLMIDMANPKVIDYLYDCLCKVFRETKADYVKWDYNRFFIDFYQDASIKGDYAYNFMMGTYKLIERLKIAFPDILFESCSSGGGRYDLGMIYYMPQTWGSDDTNSYCRTFISAGTLTGYPQSSYGAHVSLDHCPLENKNGTSSLEDRFNLHSTGAFGYEFDFRKISIEDQKTIAKQIEYYKQHRHLFQFGQYIMIDNPFIDNRYYSFILVNEKENEAMLYISELEPNVIPKLWKAKGLDSNATYEIEMRPQVNLDDKYTYSLTMVGEELMNKGLDLGSLHVTNDKASYGGIYSRLLYIKKINN